MAVCAHELTFRYLLEDSRLAEAPYEIRHIGGFLRSRQVVPLHRSGREAAAAIRARLLLLQRQIPRKELGLARRAPLAPPASVLAE